MCLARLIAYSATFDDKSESRAKFVLSNKYKDLALLRVPAPKDMQLKPVTIANSTILEIG